jgi:uncharacterized tellurite resistance protein B-like protein
MFNRILTLLQGEGAVAEENRFERVQVATCALLMEVAHSDGHYQAAEAKVVHDLLAKKFDLSAAAVAELIVVKRASIFSSLPAKSTLISAGQKNLM